MNNSALSACVFCSSLCAAFTSVSSLWGPSSLCPHNTASPSPKYTIFTMITCVSRFSAPLKCTTTHKTLLSVRAKSTSAPWTCQNDALSKNTEGIEMAKDGPVYTKMEVICVMCYKKLWLEHKCLELESFQDIDMKCFSPNHSL